MNKVLAFLVLSTGVFAKADVIKCNFTEPFYSYTYNMAGQKLTIKKMSEKTEVYRNVEFKIKGPGQFEISDKNKTFLKLELDKKGSDGMSEIIYPYSAIDFNNNHGGCESNLLEADRSQN